MFKRFRKRNEPRAEVDENVYYQDEVDEDISTGSARSGKSAISNKSAQKLMTDMADIKATIRELVDQRKKGPNEGISPSNSYSLSRAQSSKAVYKAKVHTLENQLVEVNSKLLDQSREVLNQNKELQEKLDRLVSKGDVADGGGGGGSPETPKQIETGSYDIMHGPVRWRVSGFSSIIPDPDFNYFPGISFEPSKTPDGISYNYGKNKVISTIVPCYNEGGMELDRTLRSLYRQRIPPGWRVEVVIVIDGVDHMAPEMAEYLQRLFGVEFLSSDPAKNPFSLFPEAETIIVEAYDEPSAHARTPAMEGSVGGHSVVVKRHNHRKANSQMWWLGPHGSCLQCKYALATDCGTIFSRTATAYLIRRLEAESDLHAVTGFQRIMTSEQQGDGSWEICNDPFVHILRMVQRFEFEVDHVSFKSVYDTLGCMHVIPGPCGLFRYSAMGSLKEGLMHTYFGLFTKSSHGLIVGNVELVEDRIPGTLLAFPPKSNKELTVMPAEGWPRTGFVHEAIFYVEAEKPLSQLMKQRRRWLNGTFATYIWEINEGIITRSNQDPVNRILSWCLVFLNLLQGIVVRGCGPALLIIWMFRFGLFIPDLLDDPGVLFDPDMTLTDLEIDEGRLPYGVTLSGLYLTLFIAFVVGHTPQAKPVTTETAITRYSEPTAYKSDRASAYRQWLFQPVLWVNFFVILLYIVNTVGIVATLGWSGTPFALRLLVAICFAPFIMGLLDGIVRRDFRGLFGMLYSAPAALPLMIFHTVWLPAYATTRLSDLTWGNRASASLDETASALNRAKNGQRVAWVLIAVNIMVSLIVICFMQFNESAFPNFVILYTLVLSSTFVISFLDLMYRFVSCTHCFNATSDDPLMDPDEDDEDGCANDQICNVKCTDDYYSVGNEMVYPGHEVVAETAAADKGTVPPDATTQASGITGVGDDAKVYV